MISFPECLSGGELEDAVAWAGYCMEEGGTILAALNRGLPATMCGDPGFVRFWPRRFLGTLMRRHGFEVGEWKAGGRVFLKGEKGA